MLTKRWMGIGKTYRALTYAVLLLLSGSRLAAQHADGSGLVYDSLTNKYVYEFVERMPRFAADSVHADGAMLRYVSEQFRLESDPETLQFSFTMQFVIDSDGSVLGPRVYNKKPCEYTVPERRMILLLESMPKWEPGQHNGSPVPVIISVPIHISYNID